MDSDLVCLTRYGLALDQTGVSILVVPESIEYGDHFLALCLDSFLRLEYPLLLTQTDDILADRLLLIPEVPHDSCQVGLAQTLLLVEIMELLDQ